MKMNIKYGLTTLFYGCIGEGGLGNGCFSW